MKKYFIVLAAIILSTELYSCSSFVSKSEKSAVKSVLDFYGGEVNRQIGAEVKDGQSYNFFELDLKGSSFLDEFIQMPSLPASNIAYLFSSNLKDEDVDYSHVKVKLIFSNDKTFESVYAIKDLRKVESFVPLFQQVSVLLKNKDYEILLDKFDDDVKSRLDIDKLKKFCQPVDSKYGKIELTVMEGFEFVKADEDGRQLVHIAGVSKRGKNSIRISVYFDAITQKITSINFNF